MREERKQREAARTPREQRRPAHVVELTKEEQEQQEKQLEAIRLQTRVTQLRRFMEEQHKMFEVTLKPGSAVAVHHELYRGQALTIVQQGTGYAVVVGSRPFQVDYRIEGKGRQAQLKSHELEVQLKPGQRVSVGEDFKTLMTNQQESLLKKIELERELRSRQPKRDRGRGPDR